MRYRVAGPGARGRGRGCECALYERKRHESTGSTNISSDLHIFTYDILYIVYIYKCNLQNA